MKRLSQFLLGTIRGCGSAPVPESGSSGEISGKRNPAETSKRAWSLAEATWQELT